MKEQVIEEFRRRFAESPRWVIRAPGRVNLIGDHTDYNQGFVLPMAIERGVWIALRPRVGERVLLESMDFHEDLDLSLAGFQREGTTWKEYVKAVAWALRDAGINLSTWEGVVAGDVPIGSGLSSSAAFELAIARAFVEAGNLPWEPLAMAKRMQKAENEWIGVASGIMDPLISALAEAGKAALIDCRDLEIRQIAVPSGLAVVVMDTMKRRGLVDSAYNERRKQCEKAAVLFGVSSLRELEILELVKAQDRLPETVFRRARHVLSENARVIKMADSLEVNNPVVAGKLMNESHLSLRDDFEVSCRELDLIVEAAIKQPGCYGARMTGAGFGGCAVALVDKVAVTEFCSNVPAEYRSKTGVQPDFIVSAPVNGVEVLK